MNWIDGVVVGVVLLLAGLATARGFVQVFTSLAGFVLTLAVAYAGHAALAEGVASVLHVPAVWARPIAFVLLWSVAQVVYALAVKLLLGGVMQRASRAPWNRALAVVPGAIQGAIVCGLILTVLAQAPVGETRSPLAQARDAVRASALGSGLVRATLGVERQLATVFEPALRETLGVLTVKPGTTGGETISLPSTVADAPPSPDDEEQMLNLVNTERTKHDLAPLVMDPTLRTLAREYARDLLARGYFSHTSKEGLSPFDRMTNAGVIYGQAGENLALAPTLDLAHEGLMNSLGHRANILNPGFHRAGIGVLDGGTAGKLFVQEFTD